MIPRNETTGLCYKLNLSPKFLKAEIINASTSKCDLILK